MPFSTAFIGNRSRVAQGVAAHWPLDTGGGKNPLMIGRGPQAHGALHWDMRAPPPPLPPDARAMICFAGVTPKSGGDLGANIQLALAAVRAAQGWGVHGFFLSSAAVYGDPGSGAVNESAKAHPLNDYGRAKLAMEQALLDSGHPNLTILRLANVAGAGEPFDSAAAETPASLPLHRFADGTGPKRSFVGPRTLANILARLCALAAQGVLLPNLLNVAAPRPTAMADILTALGRDWHWVDAPANAIQTVYLDTTRLAALCPMPNHAGSPETLIDELSKDLPRP